MGLTPLDVRKQQFRKALSGFDPDEVKAFLGLVAGEIERLLKEQATLTEQLSAQQSRLEEYQTLERSLRDAVVAAQGMRDESRRQAEREAELILAKAELEAEGRLRQSEMRLADLRREIAALRGERQSYLIRLRALIDTHLRMVEASEARFETVERSAGVGAGEGREPLVVDPSPVPEAPRPPDIARQSAGAMPPEPPRLAAVWPPAAAPGRRP